MSDLVRLYGLTVRSEVPLHQDRPVPEGAPVDLEILLGAPVARVDDTPPGRLLLDLSGSRRFYVATQAEDGFHLRFFGTCDILLDPGLTRAVVHPVAGADRELLSVLVGGTLFAFVLTMRGETVLHASAVQVGDAALGFVGASGMGKSTLATLFCADGARLITDDVLRLDVAATPPTCALGATELRLRHAPGHLAERFGQLPAHRTTADDRHALATPPATVEDLPLAALVVPVADRTGTRTTCEFMPLEPKDALLLLMRFPRLLGWQDPRIRATAFHRLGDIVGTVPVHVAVLPWGPPFADDLARTVLDSIGLAHLADARAAR